MLDIDTAVTVMNARDVLSSDQLSTILASHEAGRPDGPNQSFFHDLRQRATSSAGRFVISLAFTIPAIIVLFTGKGIARLISVFGFFGLFWLGWLATNTFGHPNNEAGQPVNDQSLIGIDFAMDSFGEWFEGYNGLWVVAAVLSAILVMRLTKGFEGFFTAIGAFAGTLLVGNLVMTLV